MKHLIFLSLLPAAALLASTEDLHDKASQRAELEAWATANLTSNLSIGSAAKKVADQVSIREKNSLLELHASHYLPSRGEEIFELIAGSGLRENLTSQKRPSQPLTSPLICQSTLDLIKEKVVTNS